jgi:hypothetical protein
MSKLLNAYKNWLHPAGKSQAGSVNIVAQRFLQAFLDHGVEASQIPRLLPQVQIGDLQSPEKLLAILTPEILDQTAKFFGIRSQWLEGVDDEIYQYLACYKHPAVILEHLAKVVNGNDVGLSFPLRILSTTKKLDFNDESQQLLTPVIVEKIAELGEDEISRYHIYRDGFDWSYLPARIELKAIARIVDKHLHTPVPLFVISTKEMKDVLEGKLIPKQYLDGCQITSPSLEDYALTKEERVVAKEVKEIPAVLGYIQEHKLQKFTFDKPDDLPPSAEPPVRPSASVQPEVQETPKKSSSIAVADSASEQLAVTTKAEAPMGITKGAVINAFEGLHFDRDQWSKYLASPPKWLKECRVAKGNKSTSATWNPVLIASALSEMNVPIKKLDAVFVRLPKWVDEWQGKSDFFR